MNSPKQIGLISCIGIVAGNMMGSGIALLPSSLAKTGTIAIYGWLIAMVGALALAYVFSMLAVKNPQSGGPIAYAGEVGAPLGYQTSILFYHANWIGNLAIAITAISYLSVFFPILSGAIPSCIAVLICIWLFTGLNLLGGAAVSKITSIGLILMLIPVIGTSIFGWLHFDPAIYSANWIANKGMTSNKAITSSVVLCLWAFVGIETASVSTGLVKNPKRTVPLATMIGTFFAGVVYISASQVIGGMFPNAIIQHSGAPFSLSFGMIVGEWVAPIVSLFTAITCLTSLGSWMMLVGQAGKRAAEDGNFPKIFGEADINGTPKKGLIIASCMMSITIVVIAITSSAGADAADIFTVLTSVAVILTLLPYMYCAFDLIRIEQATTKNVFSLLTCIIAILFCFVAIIGADQYQITAIPLIIMVTFAFYANKLGKQNKSKDLK